MKAEDFMQANFFRVEAIVTNDFHVVSQEGMYFVTMSFQLLMSDLLGVVFLQGKRLVFL
jgi:hypothetical protein